MRIIMMGTGPFGTPAFRQLYDTRHEIVAVVTGPVRTRHGKPVAHLSPIRGIAAEHHTPIFDPDDVNTPGAVEHLAGYGADLLVVCDYGQILKPATLGAARLGGINIHGSLLPKYRGAAPVNWAVYHGEEQTGVTIIHMTPKVDAGPCIARAATAIGPEETAPELEGRLAEMGAALVCEAVDMVEEGTAQPLPQDPSLASKAPRLKKSDGAVDWSRPALAIKNQVRAFEPWPKTFTFWHRTDGPPVRLILGPLDVVDADAPPGTEPGTVLEVSKERLVIASGRGAVVPRSIQPAGKRMLPVEEFLRGYRLKPGDRLGSE